MKLAGHVAVVTGAGSGLGEATARHLANLGAKVAAVDVNKDRAHAVAAEIGGRAFAANVTDAAAIETLFSDITAQIGAPRLSVNCAGILDAKRIVGKDGPADLEHFMKVITVNLVGTFNVLRVAAATMSKLEPLTPSGERGVIVNTASIAAYEGQIGQAAYAASKGGVVGLTLPAARDLARHGVRVMTIAPGVAATPMITSLPDEMQAALQATVPFPSRFVAPEEFAKLVAHIADNEMLNGEVIRLDGANRLAPK
jgi:NAD(P)-dependent dehydrogenase (short-subunit alcohol dehydrogenase family)